MYTWEVFKYVMERLYAFQFLGGGSKNVRGKLGVDFRHGRAFVSDKLLSDRSFDAGAFECGRCGVSERMKT